MKFDKEIVIAVIVCGIVLVCWQPFAKYMGWIPEPVPAVQPAAPVSAPVVTATAQSAASATTPASEEPIAPQVMYPVQKLENNDLIFSIQPESGAVESIILKDYLTADRKGDIVIDQRPAASQNLGALQPGALSVFSAAESWKTLSLTQELSEDRRSYVLRRKMEIPGRGQFVLTQKWTLGEGYRSSEEVTFTNPSGQALALPRVVVSGGELQQWGTVSGDKMRSDAIKFDFLTAGGSFEDISGDAKDEKFFRKDAGEIAWVALGNKYFISILKSSQPFQLFQARTFKMVGDEKHYLISGGALYPEVSVPAQGSVTMKFDYYSGPKVVSPLNAFAPEAGRTMHLAWGPLDYLARLMLWALVKLDSLCGSYGWSIIILTIIVRLLFWPVTARANASMKRMSSVQPKIQELRAKYKDNPQMLNTKMMELYRTEKINPLGGCLPILLQIPVFFALYATLDGAVELRQVPFLWAHDLAAADTVAVLFGVLPLNPLVIAMTLLMVLQQRLTPSAMDPMQQKMMLAMPIVMLFFLYDLPSGLTLYWTVSQIFSIIQLLIQQKFNKNPSTPAPAAIKN